ncbi:MAG: metal-dependent hydrolase [Methanosarcinales archaeon]|nr:metal-dependent hydrolase [Methanosarcinales archaeon]
MKLRTHIACGILLASLVTPDPSFGVLCWAVIWSVVSDFDVYIPTVRHRAVTHSLAFALLSGALLLALGKSVTIPVVQTFFTPFYSALASLCIISHLLLDSLNPAGVPLFLPFSTKRVRFPVIGGKIRSDNLIANVGIQIIAIWVAIRIILL